MLPILQAGSCRSRGARTARKGRPTMGPLAGVEHVGRCGSRHHSLVVRQIWARVSLACLDGALSSMADTAEQFSAGAYAVKSIHGFVI